MTVTACTLLVGWYLVLPAPGLLCRGWSLMETPLISHITLQLGGRQMFTGLRAALHQLAIALWGLLFLKLEVLVSQFGQIVTLILNWTFGEGA